RRIIDAAEHYLLRGDPAPQEWFGQNVLYADAAAGYRALRLLDQHDSERLEGLGEDVGARWAPILVAWPSDAVEDSDANRRLVATSFARAPDETGKWFLEELDAEIDNHGHAFAIRRLSPDNVRALEDELLRRVSDDDLPRLARVELLGVLLGLE